MHKEIEQKLLWCLLIRSFMGYFCVSKDLYETQVLTVYSRIRPLRDLNSQNQNKTKIEQKEVQEREVEWPDGSYGLLQPRSGCPDTRNARWKTGWLFQDTENDQNENNYSVTLHAKIGVTKYGITQHFCIKDTNIGSHPWPKGTFCIYQYGLSCPKDFHSGYVYWDDENTNNKNAHEGFLPRGNYGPDTEIRFCCRWDGDLDKEIELPTERPFCLFPKNVPKCQNVKNMAHILEYVKFDDEDEANVDTQGGSYPYGIQPSKRDHYLYYCYYFKRESNNSRLNNLAVEEGQTTFTQPNIPIDDIKLKAELGNEKLVLGQSKKWITVFLAVSLVTMIFGFTALVLVRSAVVVGLNKLRGMKEGNTGNKSIDTIKEKINKKYRNLKANYQPKEALLAKPWDCEEMQELAEDYLVPTNSELQHSLALLFMKNQKHFYSASLSFVRGCRG